MTMPISSRVADATVLDAVVVPVHARARALIILQEMSSAKADLDHETEH